MSSSSNAKKRSKIRKCKRGSGEAKEAVIRIKESVKHDLGFIKGVIGIHSESSEGDVIENLIRMFKQKKIGQLSLKSSIIDQVIFFNDKDMQNTIKGYEYLLNEKQLTLDNYIKYLDTACELAKLDKIEIIEIVRNKNKNLESIANLLD